MYYLIIIIRHYSRILYRYFFDDIYLGCPIAESQKKKSPRAIRKLQNKSDTHDANVTNDSVSELYFGRAK